MYPNFVKIQIKIPNEHTMFVVCEHITNSKLYDKVPVQDF